MCAVKRRKFKKSLLFMQLFYCHNKQQQQKPANKKYGSLPWLGSLILILQLLKLPGAAENSLLKSSAGLTTIDTSRATTATTTLTSTSTLTLISTSTPTSTSTSTSTSTFTSTSLTSIPTSPTINITSTPNRNSILLTKISNDHDDSGDKRRLYQQQQQKSPRGPTFSDLHKQVVENLIKQWAPIVWLAPEEKFMPLGVEEFLIHVHPENTGKPLTLGMPVGDISEKTYLVTNTNIEQLLENKTSFIYGHNPNIAPVPIYAVVTLCLPENNPLKLDITPSPSPPMSTRAAYIPISLKLQESKNDTFRRSSRLYPMFKRIRRNIPEKRAPIVANYNLVMGETVQTAAKDLSMPLPLNLSLEATTQEAEKCNNFIANLADNVKFSLPLDDFENIVGYEGEMQKQQKHKASFAYRKDIKIPMFHVTYWMFYPFSQGKNMCTLSLGPFGSIPFPAVYGYCLGSNKDIGSHIGDWEHMSLYFNCAAEPEAMYVSAHDAGAYYTYNHLTGSFEFKKQETRKGILQRPNFPKTVTTFNDHPVLFAAKGSHGLWTAPGKHRFVKVARLYDINGFGTPWNTWKHVDITYENLKSYERSLTPSWLFFKGKWGNPKNKCHPLKRIGLNFCEYTDGPVGIPLKESHFQCALSYKN
uniref:Vacuolar protein sorting-associated protein 62 n=1 Tax=Glossina palpalis gambiensis TaxID=67801 RepID=A0A1B0AU93_9MUSC